MPHVALITLSGFRVREAEIAALGGTLPGLQKRGKALAQLPGLGLLTLAGQLPEQWTCSYRALPLITDADFLEIVREAPDLVAISALTASILEAYGLSRRLNAAGIQTILGGLHVSTEPTEANRYATSIVIGFGEAVWPQVLQDAESNTLQSIYQAQPGQSIPWVRPRIDLLQSSPARWTIQTQRGCPWNCDFCGASRLLGRFDQKSDSQIIAELAAIAESDRSPLIELADDNTFAGKQDTTAWLNAFARQRVNWMTECDWRIGEDRKLLQKIASAGCKQLLIGIESLVFRYPGMGSKQAELDRIMHALDSIQESGIAVNGCFIVGAEGETAESLQRLATFIEQSSLAEVQVTLQTPFPGTGLRARLQAEQRILPDRDWSHYTLFDVTYQPDRLSVKELEQGFIWLMQQVYSDSLTQRRNAIRRDIMRRQRLLQASHGE